MRTLGRYRVNGELGRGGVGVVWDAEEPESGRRVAIKQLLVQEAELLLRFRREGELLARVRHPSLVRVHELQELPEGPALVMERIEGRRLSELSPGELAPPQAARIVLGLAEALEALHRAGIVHRDVKPENALLDRQGQPVLIDLGLAVSGDVGRLTRTGELLGTPSYMAPEQALGKEADARTDVFGLGGVMSWLLAGRTPFGAGAPMTVLTRAATGDLQLGSLAGVDPGLRAILLRALDPDPLARFPTAAALRDALDRWLAGERPARRRARLLLAAGAGLLLAGGARLAATRLADRVPVSQEVAGASSGAASPTSGAAPDLDARLRAWPGPEELVEARLRWAEKVKVNRAEGPLNRIAWFLWVVTRQQAELSDGRLRLSSEVVKARLEYDLGRDADQVSLSPTSLRGSFHWTISPVGELLELEAAELSAAMDRVCRETPALQPVGQAFPEQLRRLLELTHHLRDPASQGSSWTVGEGPLARRLTRVGPGTRRVKDAVLSLDATTALIPMLLDPLASAQGTLSVGGHVDVADGRLSGVMVLQKIDLGHLHDPERRSNWESTFELKLNDIEERRE